MSCDQDNSKNNSQQTENKSPNNAVLTIDTFSDFPPEISGCSCYFSNNSNEFESYKYIHVSDFEKTSFMMINGVMTKFTRTDLKVIDSVTIITKARAGNYSLIITEILEKNQISEELSRKSGNITPSDNKGNSISKRFYGECGC